MSNFMLIHTYIHTYIIRNAPLGKSSDICCFNIAFKQVESIFCHLTGVIE